MGGIIDLLIKLFVHTLVALRKNAYLPLVAPPPYNPEVGLNVVDLITYHGYPVETHTVETADGYILDIHRIPHGKNDNSVTPRPVAFLMIGLLCSSAEWVDTGPEKGLGFLLADRGYDVWMGNVRGTTYSRKHVSLNPDLDATFWHYSWHEMGIYDLPAMIDYTLNYTNQEYVYYVGHSQGTTTFFILMSEKPSYNEKIRVMVALAPVAFMSNVKNPFLQFISQFQRKTELLAKLIGANELTPNVELFYYLGQQYCHEKALSKIICSNILFLIEGFDSVQLNETSLPVILSNFPAGASVRQVFHYMQSVNSGKFRQYDFGVFENYKRYGKLLPPDYNLSNVSAPVALIYTLNDLLTAPKDIKILRQKLPNVIEFSRVNFRQFNHLDFLWAIDVVKLAYNRIFDIFERYK